MAPPKKEYKNCTHCGAKQTQDTRTGFLVHEAKGKSLVNEASVNLFQIRCKCGIMTKLCKSTEYLKMVWNSRPKKPYEMQVITGGDVNLGIAETVKEMQGMKEPF